ncbi:MAG: arsenate reductase ArsC [Sphingomonadales bacterium]|nr:arsenate reductase ArsC [Sphingomonadales bacterium]
MKKHVLFICTGNSARSIMAEGIFNSLAKGRYTGFSAGSNPTGAPHLTAIKTLEKFGIDTGFARSKNWDEFSADNNEAPNIDLVVTVCGNAADEVCPVWHHADGSTTLKTHWGMEDPAKFEGSVVMQEARFDTVFSTLRQRIKAFLAHAEMPQDQKTLDDIGKISI